MTSNDDCRTLRRFIEEVVGAGDLSVLDQCFHADVVLPADTPGGGQGLDALRELLRGVLVTFDSTTTVEHLIAEGDKVAARTLIRGKQVGEFMGHPADGQRFAIEEMLIAQFRAGKISRLWRVVDLYSLCRQLGTLPTQPVSRAAG